jgi:molybdopterin converting factor subunit 1
MAELEQITIQVLLFGQAREIVGQASLELSLPGLPTVESAFQILKELHPKLGEMERSLLFAVNEAYASRTQVLSAGDRLAILPPVSGGEPPAGNQNTEAPDVFELTREPIDIQALRRRLLGGESGALVIFDGVVRNNSKGRRTRFLEYEGYEEMALRTFEQIALEVHEKWPISRLGIIHRLGRIEISQSSVVIIIASPHRKQAFEACRYAIDRLKKIAPIWKKEYFEDGEVWVENEEDRQQAP